MTASSMASSVIGNFEIADEQYELLKTSLSSGKFQSMEHGEIETFVQQEGTELLRLLIQSHLDLRSIQEQAYEGGMMGADGVPRPHRRLKTQRQLATLFGEVKVTRLGYSTKQPGLGALYPEDGKLNLAVDQYSDGLRRRIAQEASKVSFAETSQSISETTGAEVGKRQCEEVTVKVAQDFEEFYAQRQQNQPELSQDLLVLSSDGKGIVMHSSDLREATAKAAQEKASKPSKARLGPGEKSQSKRMATVASVYSTPRFERRAQQLIGEDKEDLERPKIVNKRVWASVKKNAKDVIGSAFEEAQSRDPMHEREWVVLVDGESHQLSYIKAEAQKHQVNVTIVLDFIHVMEYLWNAAHCFFSPGSEGAQSWVEHRALGLLQGKSSPIAAGMRRSATLQNLSKKERKNVDKCADYLLKYRNFIRYDHYLARGHPIASGVIEGACRHLVKDRMDITGARWRLDRAEAILKIRALRTSQDFEAYWTFHKMQEFKRNHADKFQDPQQLLVA